MSVDKRLERIHRRLKEIDARPEPGPEYERAANTGENNALRSLLVAVHNDTELANRFKNMGVNIYDPDPENYMQSYLGVGHEDGKVAFSRGDPDAGPYGCTLDRPYTLVNGEFYSPEHRELLVDFPKLTAGELERRIVLFFDERKNKR